MNCKCNIKVIFALVFIIVYLVIKIYENPKYEFFYDNHDNLVENVQQRYNLSDELVAKIEQDKERFLKQTNEQNVQNRTIAELKRKIDDYRNDIIIHKNNDKDEMKSIYKKLGYDDSVAEALSASGGDLNTALKTVQEVGLKNGNFKGGKNYNLNFNLDE